MTDYRTKNRPLSNNVSAHCFRYIFNVNDQNIGPLSPSLPLSLISLSPYLLLSLSLSPSIPLSLSHSLPISLSPSPTLLTSLSSSIPLSLSPSTSLLLSLSTSLYLSPLSLPGTRTSNACRHRACYTTTLVVIISYQGNQGYPGNQLLEFL